MFLKINDIYGFIYINYIILHNIKLSYCLWHALWSKTIWNFHGHVRMFRKSQMTAPAGLVTKHLNAF
jgi:hypothetical protein